MSEGAPLPIPMGVSGEQAIELCRRWMIHLGAVDAVSASGEVRRTCDIYSQRFVAWVDNHRGNLEPDLVDRAAQVSASDGRQALVFVRGGVLPEAQRRADAYGVALFCFIAMDGSLEGANSVGFTLRARGLA
ncbi:hypothetical protein [Leifsonia sp. EB34]|uniref:hypothetical protein n=1 Tax=Leifsonia sp. EB34 TaxID=3156303 RepID=UPI003514AD9D